MSVGINEDYIQGSSLHWSCLFLITQLKRSRQYWHSYVAQTLWKTLFCFSRPRHKIHNPIHLWERDSYVIIEVLAFQKIGNTEVLTVNPVMEDALFIVSMHLISMTNLWDKYNLCMLICGDFISLHTEIVCDVKLWTGRRNFLPKGPFALGDNDTDFWRCKHVVRDGLHCHQCNCSHMTTEKNTSLLPSANGPLNLVFNLE